MKTIPEIMGACSLGRGELTGESYIQRIKPIFQRETERMKRISQRRFLEHARHAAPENQKLESLLEHWADRKILTRQWRIGPCGRCGQTYFVPNLNIQRRIICTNCGHRISLPSKVPIGYTLHRAVGHAIKEGVIPVALAGRFLYNMTDHGFLWLPGVKYQIGTKQGDIDILACCDGRLVFCECKNLEETPADSTLWDSVVDQFLETATIAKTCGASLVILAAQVGMFPQTVVDRINAALGASLPHLLLNKNDLERGHREIHRKDHPTRLSLDDLIPLAFPERPRELADKPRTISIGWGTWTG
jgi:DNA-directed RNA polymerase subunit RPC12/RpoP